METWKAYTITITSVIATSLAGRYYTNKNVKSEWYNCIRPSITPPPVVFPLVWSMLYMMIAIAFGRSLIHSRYNVSILFMINLLLNVIWCYFYFGLQSPSKAFPYIILIWISIVALMLLQFRDSISVLLIVPYFIWITFALVLNLISTKKEYKCSVNKI